MKKEIISFEFAFPFGQAASGSQVAQVVEYSSIIDSTTS